MKPFYEAHGISLFLGDCREVVPALAIGVDLVLADPPYGDTSLKWDRWVFGWVDLVRPLIKPTGSLWCFGSMRMFLTHADEFFANYRLAQDIVWEKHNGSGFHADRFKRVHEHAVQFYPTGARWESVFKAPVTTNDARKRQVIRRKRPTHMGNVGEHRFESKAGGPRLMRSVLRVRSMHGRAVHPTQKPENIVAPLLRYSCPKGGMVLDPFAGSGTTLLVARQLGMRAIGIEADRESCEKAAERLAGSLPLGSAA